MTAAPPPLPRRAGWEALPVLALAAAYFTLGFSGPMELVEEGMLVYPASLIAQGALPYRDFHLAYAPGSLAFNGALLALFGPDLLVVRLGLLAVKAVVAALLYALGRRVADRPAALLATLPMVVVWGLPVWVFNTPYASHYGMALGLGAALLLAGRPTLARAAAAGLLVGVAATVKQTLGAFFAGGMALAVVLGAPPVPFLPAPARLLRGLVWVALAAVAVLPVAYVWRDLPAWSPALLGGPLVLGAVTAARAARRDADAAARGALLIALGLAAALPVAAMVAFFAAHGVLGALIFDTAGGLLSLLRWYVPLPRPPVSAAALLAAAVAFLLAARMASLGRWAATAGWGGAAAAAVIAFVGLVHGAGGAAMAALLALVNWLPVGLLWGTAPVLIRRRATAPAALPLIWCLAAAALVQLYPAADLPHAANVLPAVLPLLAFALQRGIDAEGGHRGLRTGAAVVVIALLVAPGVGLLAANRGSGEAAFARATAVHPVGARAAATAELARRLAAEPAPTPVWMVGAEQMLYFLADRRSALPREEMTLYFIAAGLLPEPEAVARLIDETAVIDTLRRTRPLIVDEPGGMTAGRVRAALPRVAAFVARHYLPAERIGPYQVLRWSDAATPSTP